MRPFLRDRPTHEMTGQVDALTVALEQLGPGSDDAGKRSRLLGLRGDLLRILDRHDEALTDLRQALESAPDADTRVRHRIRIGTVLFYGGDHAGAEPELRAALAEAEDLGDERLTSFAHQHLAKCLAEAGRLDEARDAFETAFDIRYRLGENELASSSLQALRALESRYDEG
ncbi:MAG: tetratricopeptide repeat protein [Planctomycetota bacterium]|nr:tetratricopeptide repeat protein [Planctomycetota bacterium]